MPRPEPLLIAPFKTGWDTDLDPWLIPVDGMQDIENIHIHHGRLEKRAGYLLWDTLQNGLPVMGFSRYTRSDSSQITLAFDTTHAYRYNPASFSFFRLDTNPIFEAMTEEDFIVSAQWHSTNSTTNRLYFTNGLPGTPVGAPVRNGIKRYDGDASINVTTQFTPVLNTTGTARTLIGAKFVFVLGGRMVCLFTYEYDTSTTSTNAQRARWSAKQNSSLWADDVAGQGGFVDAGTGEQIVSAQALQNQLIVFFTNSVWTLILTGDPARPFRWERINSFRACDGKMASVGYDRYATSLGVRGITATDGVETRRVDERIEDFVTDEVQTDTFGSVFCARNFEKRRWWTLYNDPEAETSFLHNSALIYDDESSSYSKYVIALTCLGYGNYVEDTPIEGLQDGQELFLGGNNIGQVFILDYGTSDNGATIDAYFRGAAWTPFKDAGISAQLNYVDLFVDTDPDSFANLVFYKDSAQDGYSLQSMDFLPPLDFVAPITNSTQTNPVQVTAVNHGLTTGETVYIYLVQGMVEINSETSGTGYTATVIDENTFSLNGVDGTAYTAYSSAGGVYLKEFYRTTTWKRVYAGGIGWQHTMEFINFGTTNPFRIHALKPYFKPIGKRTTD